MRTRFLFPILAFVAFGACAKGGDGPAEDPHSAHETAEHAPAHEATPAAPAAAPAAQAEVEKVAAFDAKATYAATCAPCHGAEGGGDGPTGVVLKPRPAAFNTAEFWASRDRAHLIKVITHGGTAVGKSPLMAGFGGQFSAEEIEQIATIVEGFKP